METDSEALTPGTLYLVATPIGNLEDITLRALRILKGCDLIAAEDTRRTGLLLKQFNISKRLLSYYQFNEAKRTQELLGHLERGETVALVTDGGTPGISDPGVRAVRAARQAGFQVEAIPGPSALLVALPISGFPTEPFHFFGFLPPKAGKRRNRLEQMSALEGTIILYESPYRIEKLLKDLKELFPRRRIGIGRELTKRYEEFLEGTAEELLQRTEGKTWKGELVVLLSGTQGRRGPSHGSPDT